MSAGGLTDVGEWRLGEAGLVERQQNLSREVDDRTARAREPENLKEVIGDALVIRLAVQRRYAVRKLRALRLRRRTAMPDAE